MVRTSLHKQRQCFALMNRTVKIVCLHVYTFLFMFELCEGLSANNLQKPTKADYPFIVMSWPHFHSYRELNITRRKKKDLWNALFVVEHYV